MAAPAVGSSDPPQRRGDRLFAELQSSWLLLARLLDHLSRTASSLEDTPLAPSSLRSARERYEEDSRVLLLEPIEQFQRSQPIRRSLEAMRQFDHEAVGLSRDRARIDSRFQDLLTQSAIDLCEPWRIRRRGGHRDEWRVWRDRCAAHVKQSSALLEQYSRWARETREDAGANNRKHDKQLESRYAKWWRQDRAVTALLEMEVSFRDLDVTLFRAAEDFVDKAGAEREGVLGCARRTLGWIESDSETASTAPERVLELVSPDERLRTWTHSMETDCTAHLPEHADLITPGRHPHWRSIAPKRAFFSAFASYAQPSMRQIVEEYWSRTSGIMLETARAREIIDYWRETSPVSSDGRALFDDARHNAAAMLAEQAKTPLALEDLEAKLVDLFRVWNEEGFTSIEAEQFGWAGLLQRPGGREFLSRTVLRSGQQKARTAVRRSGRWAADRLDHTLESIEGRVPSRSAVQPVVRRTTLRDTLALPASKINLPALYSLLFRPAPVEDRRFLVGRDQELDGLAQAVRDWDAARFAACLVVGARGSGKTSLLNCASRDAFAAHTLVRGQFHERALNREKIDCVLRQLLGLAGDTDLEAAFREQRHILVIEESERIFLRKVGGFEAAHYLIRLIHRTASTTLWIIGMNDKALRVLDAGAGFRRVFSHRINAMSLSRDDLEKAVLERHRLSGLRLEFAAPPPEDPRVHRLKGWIGLQDSPRKLFFDSLFQQSEGILRSAFELWLSSIDRVEGETLKMRQPLDPAFARFRSELSPEDHFTLLAIQEHGSLTERELSEVLCEAEEVGGSRLDRLLALGLIEPDPEHPGLRVRPEAQRFTNDLLRRANLN